MAVIWTSRKCFVLGVLAAIGWLAANFIDLLLIGSSAPLPNLPFWARLALRAPLVVSLPVLVLLLDRQARTWLRSHPVFALAVALPAVLVAALPALLPLGRQQDLLALPILVSTASLGVALGIGGGANRLRRPATEEDNDSQGVTAGLGFGLTVLLAGIILIIIAQTTASCTGALLGCGGLIQIFITATCGLTLCCVVTGFLAGTLGYAAGIRLTHLARGNTNARHEAARAASH